MQGQKPKAKRASGLVILGKEVAPSIKVCAATGVTCEGNHGRFKGNFNKTRVRL